MSKINKAQGAFWQIYLDNTCSLMCILQLTQHCLNEDSRSMGCEEMSQRGLGPVENLPIRIFRCHYNT